MRSAVITLVLCGAAFAEVREVTVYLQDHASVAFPVLNRAISQASTILASAGVHLEWRRRSSLEGDGCRAAIHLVIQQAAPPELQSDVMAVTQLSTGSITVY